MQSDIQTILFAAAGGILPAFIWLWFWLKEDSKHPEPRRLIGLAFVTGMIVVFPILSLESLVYQTFSNQVVRMLTWVAIEELGKLIVAAAVVLWRKEVDEPIDFVIYLITTALGFSAMENALFLINPLQAGLTSVGLATGDLRFIGATLVHVSAAAVIGMGMGFGFYKKKKYKREYLLIGVILALALHAAFNLSIIMTGGKYSLFISAFFWAIVVALLLIIEKIKRIHPSK